MMSSAELKRFQTLLTFEDPRLPKVFTALSDANRCRIFRLLSQTPTTRFCVSDIANLLKITVATASTHLKTLTEADLLLRERSGQSVSYTVNQKDQLVKIILKAIT